MVNRADSARLLSDQDLQGYVSRILDVIPLPIIISKSSVLGQGEREHLHFNKAFVKELGYTMAQIPNIETWFERAYPQLTIDRRSLRNGKRRSMRRGRKAKMSRICPL